MKKDLKKLIREKRLFLDGATGTVLQSLGLPPGVAPYTWNLTHPEKVVALHRAYLDAGCTILTTNTFGVDRNRCPDYKEVIEAAIACAKEAASGREDVYIAFDVGPTGRLPEPLGDLPFEEAVSLFSDGIRVAAGAGADLILIETMNDSCETRAALLAAKECSTLPVFVTNVYDERGRLMTGADPVAMIAILEGMGADAIGVNCSLGPDQMLPLLDLFSKYASVPILVCPNAGLPSEREGKTVYDLDAEAFSDRMRELALRGACLLGGCCGTTPEYLRKTVEKTKDLPYSPPKEKSFTLVSSYSHAVEIGADPVLIGERINPTGKPKMKEALRAGNFGYLLSEAVRQEEAGAGILDVNIGLPEINEAEKMPLVVSLLQTVTDLPLQIDSSSEEAIAAALRLYNGKALINSVNGEKEKMEKIFPLMKKYGGVAVALTMDERGIPETAAERVAIAQKIIDTASRYGLSEKDLIFDPLALSVSANEKSALVTLEAVEKLSSLGLKTVLGVSNISFGLPSREKINMTFFASALEKGLSAAIVNPFSLPMTDVYHAFRLLHGLDPACGGYIAYAEAHRQEVAPTLPVPQKKEASGTGKAPSPADSLRHAVVRGMKEEAVARAAALLSEGEEPLAVINREILPALNEIGDAFEARRAYLPQLLLSAEAASAAFEILKEKLPPSDRRSGESVLLATVRGDIHDIGKNIVKVLLESYGFTVYDLGRDVPPEEVVKAATEKHCRLVGLSALMTTTVPAMAETVRLLHEADPLIKVAVGGAVLNQEYADSIHADFYSKEAIDTVRYAERFYGRTPDGAGK